MVPNRRNQTKTRSTIEGGRGCNNFVPVLRGNGTKIAPTGDIFDQPPGGRSWIRGKLADHVGDHVVLSPEEGVLVTSLETESSYPRLPQSLNNFQIKPEIGDKQRKQAKVVPSIQAHALLVHLATECLRRPHLSSPPAYRICCLLTLVHLHSARFPWRCSETEKNSTTSGLSVKPITNNAVCSPGHRRRPSSTVVSVVTCVGILVSPGTTTLGRAAAPYTENTLHRRKTEMVNAPLLVQQFTHPVHLNNSYRLS